MQNSLDQFTNQSYLNLKTYRKNGEEVATPLWFVQEGKTIFVRTISGSGKVKRVHNNPNVEVMPCGLNGEPLGDWVPAVAGELDDARTYNKVAGLLAAKYGKEPKVYETNAIARGEKYTVLEIKLKKRKTEIRMPELTNQVTKLEYPPSK
jgi:PPOX class probable F420-dependent enzyme